MTPHLAPRSTLTLLLLAGCSRAPAPVADSRAGAEGGATFVGAAACAECHARETEKWRGSHHARAMQAADATSVLGDFGGATFTKDGVATKFTSRDGEYFARTDGPDGALHDYRIRDTFGIAPLQQFLVELPGGRLQALDVAWDARPAENGGQRWFALHPDERVDFRGVLHWTGPALNWNHMCADCHSTWLRKNWRPESETFETKFSDVNVACEACHGPGSVHLEWARRSRDGKAAQDSARGLSVRLERTDGEWEFPAGEAIARRRAPLASPVELDTCGRCHSRRAELAADPQVGVPLGRAFRVALLDEELYFADGEMKDEVYEYGSFLQSRMHAEGVTCSDCHDPHSGRLRIDGNLLCAQCHQHSKYDGPQHHFHGGPAETTLCVSCHMPQHLYMVVDGRRDHGFRIPRPDLTLRIGVPNACNACHRDRDAKWAAAAVENWYGPKRKSAGWHWAEAIHAGREASVDAEPQLLRVLGDPKLPAIVRATAVDLLPRYLSPRSLPLLEAAFADPDPLVRRAAAGGLLVLEPEQRIDAGQRLLADPMLDVRLEALDALLDLPRESLDPARRHALDAAIEEYRRVQAANGDRGESHVNLGVLEMRLGDVAAAEREFRTAIRLAPHFLPARVQLADLVGRGGREAEGEKLLREAVALEPDAADVHHALALSLLRQKRTDDALAELARAAELAPRDVQHVYVLAIARHDTGDPAQARTLLEQAHARFPAERRLLTTLVGWALEANDRAAALASAKELLELAPWDESASELIRKLEGG